MKVLLPVHGSDSTKRMLSYIATHEELLGADHEYTIFTAVHAIPAHAAPFVDRSTLDDHYRDRADEVLRPMRPFADRHGGMVREVPVAGDAAQAIAALAEAAKVDLIVMGTHGRLRARQLGAGIGGERGAGTLQGDGAVDPLSELRFAAPR